MKEATDFKNRLYSFSTARSYLVILLLIMNTSIAAQQKVIQLYEGAAPGSENWNWNEKETNKNPMNFRIVYNVVHPSLTVFLPDPAVANGSAVIVCPGGALHVLIIEGITNVAKELNRKGVTAFVLKYRLVRSFTDDPWQEMSDIRKDTAASRQKKDPVQKLSTDDVANAVNYVRQHAEEFKVDRKRIGLLGFSAGGILSANIAYNYTPETRPDFVGLIYGVNPWVRKTTIQQDAPPLFIAAATDDQNVPVSYAVVLYSEWIAAKHSAELHLYSKGGHGLRGFPAESWIIRFEEWLDVQGFLKPGK